MLGSNKNKPDYKEINSAQLMIHMNMKICIL